MTRTKGDVMFPVRQAREADVGQIRDIYYAVYGSDYPHHEVYDETWLKRAIFMAPPPAVAG